jgi:hypothetical protein
LEEPATQKAPAKPSAPALFASDPETDPDLGPLQHELLAAGLDTGQIRRLFQRGYALLAPQARADARVLDRPFADYLADKLILLRAAQLAGTLDLPPADWLIRAVKYNWVARPEETRRLQISTRAADERRQADLKAQYDRLKQARSREEQQAIETFLAENPEILSRLIASVRTETPLLTRTLDPQAADFENYKKAHITLRPAVNERVRQEFPDVVAGIQNRYAPQLQELEELLA